MTSPKDREKEIADRYPHYKTYAKCQGDAFRSGTYTFVLGTAGAFAAQELVRHRLPYPRKTFILSSVITGSVAAYAVTRRKTKNCQKMWMALEERHTVLTSVDERKQMEAASESEPDTVSAANT